MTCNRKSPLCSNVVAVGNVSTLPNGFAILDRNFLSPLASMLSSEMELSNAHAELFEIPFDASNAQRGQNSFPIGVDGGLRSGDWRIRATQRPPSGDRPGRGESI